MSKRVVLEWRDEEGDAAGGSYPVEKLSAVLAKLCKRGIKSAYVDGEKWSTEAAKFSVGERA